MQDRPFTVAMLAVLTGSAMIISEWKDQPLILIGAIIAVVIVWWLRIREPVIPPEPRHAAPKIPPGEVIETYPPELIEWTGAELPEWLRADETLKPFPGPRYREGNSGPGHVINPAGADEFGERLSRNSRYGKSKRRD